MQTFPIAPVGTRMVWILPIVLLPVLAALVVLVLSILGGWSATFEVSRTGLRLRGDLYGRLIPAGQLRTAAATRVSFAARPELLPARRTLGTGLPDYQSGWFRLRNGEKALVYLTDHDRAVYVPTTAGYSVMVSPADPEAFLAALHSIPQSNDQTTR